MRGLYTEDISDKISAERFFEDSEEGFEPRAYDVYKIQLREKTFILKKSDEKEIFIYEHFLKGNTFSVPQFYGSLSIAGENWIVIEYITGSDLREFTGEMAHACAESVSAIMNTYWQKDAEEFESKRQDNRFEQYWKRINKRVNCLKNEPELKAAYEVFLQRQKTCPRTLCNGDFLQFNAIYTKERVILIDWAFGGIMPYSLDIARLIAHGTEDRRIFPFYMNDRYRSIFVKEVYEKLNQKPSWEQYLFDIRLAMLNEYIEFIEEYLIDESYDRDKGFDYYYSEANKLAKEILR